MTIRQIKAESQHFNCHCILSKLKVLEYRICHCPMNYGTVFPYIAYMSICGNTIYVYVYRNIHISISCLCIYVEVRTAETLFTFKCKLKPHLFKLLLSQTPPCNPQFIGSFYFFSSQWCYN